MHIHPILTDEVTPVKDNAQTASVAHAAQL